MKVWIVTWHDWCGACDVCGVFSTEEKARTYYNTSPDFFDEPVEREVDEHVKTERIFKIEDCPDAPNPEAGACWCPVATECYEGWYDEYWYKTHDEEGNVI